MLIMVLSNLSAGIWEVMPKSLNIKFIHGMIHGLSRKKHQPFLTMYRYIDMPPPMAWLKPCINHITAYQAKEYLLY